MAAPSARKLRVINFERVSTDRQETERQKYDLSDNVEQFNLDVVDTVRMKLSGTKVNKSKEWLQMLSDMARPDRDAINLSALDRLVRPENFTIIADALQVFIDHKKSIISTKEGLIEPWTPRGYEVCLQAIMQAAKELAELKRRTKGGRRKAHAENKPMNTSAPYGILYRDRYSKDADGGCQYFYEDFTPASNGQSRREVVEMIFHWRDVEHLKTYKIVKRLNTMGILSAGLKKKDGTWQYAPGLWQKNTVLQLLQNRHYIGEHVEGGKLINVACPTFIDRDVFERVQRSFVVNVKGEEGVGRESKKLLLSEKLHCAHCTKKLYASHKPTYSYYRCVTFDQRQLRRACDMRSVRAENIDPIVFGAILGVLTQAEILIANARQYYESLPSAKQTARLEKERAELNAGIERIQSMIHRGRMDEEKGGALIDADMKRVREIEADLRAAGAMLTMPTAHQIEAACRLIASGPMPSTFDTQRPVLDKLVDLNVVWDGEYVTVTGKVPVANREQKCKRRVNGDYTSTLFIPFNLKERIA